MMVRLKLSLSLSLMVTVSPAEDVFARNGGKTRDLAASAARESENPFELQKYDNHGEDLGCNTWSLNEFPAKR